MNNLYIIGCPRSMTCLVYYACTQVLGGAVWSNSGEILNPDMIQVSMTETHLYMKQHRNEFPFWSDENRNIREEVLQQFEESPEFGIMKDVVVPHIVCDFVDKQNLNTLLVYKEIPMIAYSCLKRGWVYPSDILHEKSGDNKVDVLNALHYMYTQYFEPLSKKSNVEIISTDKLQQSEAYIWKRLKRLGYSCKKPKYITPGFKRKTKKVQGYKQTELYKELCETYSTIIK